MPVDNDHSATIDYVTGLQRSNGGFSPAVGAEPTIPATLAAVRVLNYLGIAIPDIPYFAQCQAFVSSCIDRTNGGIGIKVSPNGETDVYSTSVGTLALVELEIASVDICKAIVNYLYATVKDDFINTYFAAFAWEAISDVFPTILPDDDKFRSWISTINAKEKTSGVYGEATDNVATTAEAVAAKIRLGAVDSFENYDESATFLLASQNPGSGYGESAGSDSNIAVTYEVMRAFNLLTSLSFIGGQEALLPSDKEAVIKFVASCNNNTDGGYGDPPQAPSSAANPTYFATYTLKYLSAL